MLGTLVTSQFSIMQSVPQGHKIGDLVSVNLPMAPHKGSLSIILITITIRAVSLELFKKIPFNINQWPTITHPKNHDSQFYVLMHVPFGHAKFNWCLFIILTEIFDK